MPNRVEKSLRSTLREVARRQSVGLRAFRGQVDKLRQLVILAVVQNERLDVGLLGEIRAQLELLMERYNGEFAQLMSEEARRVFTRGIRVVDEALKAADVAAALPHLDETVLSQAQGFRADLVRRITDEARYQVMSELQLAMLGQKPRDEVVRSIGRSLGSPGIFGTVWDRAEIVYTTEMARMQNLAQEKRIEQASGQVRGLKKRWLHSHLGMPRINHLAMDGVTVAAKGKFQLPDGKRSAITHKVDGPHDPKLPAHEVINCRCTVIPVVPELERDFPRGITRKYYSERAQRPPSDMVPPPMPTPPPAPPPAPVPAPAPPAAQITRAQAQAKLRDAARELGVLSLGMEMQNRTKGKAHREVLVVFDPETGDIMGVPDTGKAGSAKPSSSQYLEMVRANNAGRPLETIHNHPQVEAGRPTGGTFSAQDLMFGRHYRHKRVHAIDETYHYTLETIDETNGKGDWSKVPVSGLQGAMSKEANEWSKWVSRDNFLNGSRMYAEDGKAKRMGWTMQEWHTATWLEKIHETLERKAPEWGLRYTRRELPPEVGELFRSQRRGTKLFPSIAETRKRLELANRMGQQTRRQADELLEILKRMEAPK